MAVSRKVSVLSSHVAHSGVRAKHLRNTDLVNEKGKQLSLFCYADDTLFYTSIKCIIKWFMYFCCFLRLSLFFPNLLSMVVFTWPCINTSTDLKE